MEESIRDRVKEFRRVPASELRANPKNWRKHPEAQRAALSGVLSQVGFADAVIARELPDGSLELVDGHLRAEEMGDQEIPVLVLDVDEREADIILATHDPLAALAQADPPMLARLADGVVIESVDLSELIGTLAEGAGVFEVEEVDPVKIADGPRSEYRTRSFVLHEEQDEAVESAVKAAIADGYGESECNANRNGNALSRLADFYLDTKGP